MVDKRQSLRLRWTIVFKTNLSVNDDEKIWVNFLYISCDLGIAIYFTLEFGKYLFHFCFLHYYCLGITRKLCEQLSTYPSNDPTKVNWWQVMVNVRLVEGVGVHLFWYWHLSTCGYPSKTLTQKSLPLFSANVPSLNKLISYENFTNCLEIWSEDSWNIKLYEGIPFFEIGKYLISKLDRKIAKQQIEISKNPRTILKTNPSGLKLCRNLLMRSVLITDFLKGTPSD